MKPIVYYHLLQINSAFDQIGRSLEALKPHRQFHSAELSQYRRLSKEVRASINSYLTAIIEAAETTEAGARFRRRRTQERAEEAGNGRIC